MNILISGASGFIGSYLVPSLLAENHTVYAYCRTPKNAPAGTIAIDRLSAMQGEAVDVIINLAGAPISRYWNASYKQQLINSRIQVTNDLMACMNRLKDKPKLMMSASAVGYYGTHDADMMLDEHSSCQDGFTHQLCDKWERAAKQAADWGVRLCIFRLGVVLGKGGALQKMLTAYRLGLGGRLGSGTQAFSWIHIDDAVRALMYLMNAAHTCGIYNLTAPNPATNQAFSQTLATVLKRPCWFTLPAWLVSVLFGEMGRTLLLSGQSVLPKRLLADEFVFQYPKLKPALEQLLLDQ